MEISIQLEITSLKINVAFFFSNYGVLRFEMVTRSCIVS